jgi:enoyl-CoA hydratase
MIRRRQLELETVIYEERGHLGVIRLNRPERMNAVIEDMYRDLQVVLEQARSTAAIRALILTGSVWHRPEGDKQAFCAGADLKKHSAGDRTPWQKRGYIHLAHETTRLLYELPKPLIAAINGPARGAGAEMALNCDFVIMADNATIAFPETGLGTFVGGGVTSHLPQLVGMTMAKRLIYTGEVLDGPAAVACGLALSSVSLDQLMPTAEALASRLAERAPISMSFAKEQLRKAPGRDLRTVLLVEAEAILACMKTEDWAEGIASFREKRNPDFKGR